MMSSIVLLLLSLLDIDDNSPKHDLHRKESGFKLNEDMIILMLFVLCCIFFICVFFFIGSCTESGLLYNSNLY